MINKQKISRSITTVRTFINVSLGISLEKSALTGFELSKPVLDAAAYNTYFETVGNKADTLYAHAKKSMSEMVTHAYIDLIRAISPALEWKSKPATLAFDYTEEDFYGEVQGLDIHGWKKGEAITGHFKFLTCSLISDDIQEKIPLISIPIQLGHNMSYAVIYCIKLIEPYIGPIQLILFDRGFYAKELMYDLKKLNLHYLILVKKGKKENYLHEELSKMEKEEKKIIPHTYKLNINKTYHEFESKLAFLKSIFTKNLNKEIDWIFATNLEEIQLDTIIQTYRKRWRIETQFRIQDEATIKCKSKEMKIRYFIFTFEQVLQTIWTCFYKKEEVSFKEFLIEIHKVNQDLVAHPKISYKKSLKTSRT